MKRTKRVAGMMTLVAMLMSLTVIGCGDSPTASLTADDGTGTYPPPSNIGGGGDRSNDGKSLDSRN